MHDVALHRFFWPRSVALIGASGPRGSLAARPLRLLQQHGYDGRLYPVDPRYEELRGIACYPSVDDLPEVPDLAMILVNAEEVPTIVDLRIEGGQERRRHRFRVCRAEARWIGSSTPAS